MGNHLDVGTSVLHGENCTGKAWPGLRETMWPMNGWVSAAPFQDRWWLWELAGFTELPFWVRKIILLEQPLQCWWGLSNGSSCPKRTARSIYSTKQGGGMWSSNCLGNNIILSYSVNGTIEGNSFALVKEICRPSGIIWKGWTLKYILQLSWERKPALSWPSSLNS